MDYRKELDFVVSVIRKNAEEFKYTFPQSQSRDYVYYHLAGLNNSWAEGFWNGMLMLAYEDTKSRTFLDSAMYHGDVFAHKIKHKYGVDHHDMGFLYSLGCVSIYKVTGDEQAKQSAIAAADHLLTRYKPVGKFIRAWGDVNSLTGNRLIIDTLLNIPLLFWASEVTGDPKYREVAENHFFTATGVLIRDDYTTHHTYLFDPHTGEPLYGETDQGLNNESTWSRGQAWGVYGTALAYKYLKDERALEMFKNVTRKFIELLPSDYVPYWDFTFNDGSDEPRDTSASACVCAAILSMRKYADVSEFMPAVEKMLEALSKNYTARRLKSENNVILTDAMYDRPLGDEPEANIWGDYFYTEAIYHMVNPDWEIYW